MDEKIDLTALQNIDTTGLDSMNTGADMVMYTDYINILGTVSLVMNILWIIFYFTGAWGLYMINKKLGNKHSWLAFFPILQLFIYKDAAGLSWKKIFGWFFGTLLGVFILSILIGFIGGAINVDPFVMNIIIYIVSLFMILIPYFIIKYFISNGISKRTGRGGWTTAGLFFIPFIMYPVVAYKFKGLAESEKEEKKVVEL